MAGRNNIGCHIAVYMTVNQKQFIIKTLCSSDEQVVYISESCLIYSDNNYRNASEPHHTQ